MDLQKRITKIEQTATDAENTAYKIPYAEVEKLDFVQNALFFDFCMWQNPNVEVVGDPNEPDDEELGNLLGRLADGELDYEGYQAEYQQRFGSDRPRATHDEIGEAIGRNKQNPFNVEKWLKEVSI